MTWPARVTPPIANIDELIARLPLFPQKLTFDDGEGCTQDNVYRAGRAALAVIAYSEATRMNGEDFPTIFGDLLGDLRHLADLLGIDIEDAFDHGFDHYAHELEALY